MCVKVTYVYINLCVSVCMCLYACVSMYVCVCIRMYMYACVCMAQDCRDASRFVCSRTAAQNGAILRFCHGQYHAEGDTYTCLYICIYICVCVCVCEGNIYIYIRMHIWPLKTAHSCGFVMGNITLKVIHIYMFICISIYIYVYMCVCEGIIYVCMYICSRKRRHSRAGSSWEISR